MTALARQHDGTLGVTVLRLPHPQADPEIVTIAHCDTEAHLAAWMEDPERAAMTARSAEVGAAPEEFVTEPGMEFWFTPADVPAIGGASIPGAAQKPPARWKIASVLTALIFLPSRALMALLSPVVAAGVPRPAVQFVALSIQVALLRSWTLPKLTRLLSFRLNPMD